MNTFKTGAIAVIGASAFAATLLVEPPAKAGCGDWETATATVPDTAVAKGDTCGSASLIYDVEFFNPTPNPGHVGAVGVTEADLWTGTSSYTYYLETILVCANGGVVVSSVVPQGQSARVACGNFDGASGAIGAAEIVQR